MNDAQLNFRAANLADVSQISANETASHITPWTEKLVEDSLKGSHLVWLVEYQQQVIGHIVMLPVLEQWELLNIVINSQLQTRGFGKQAMEFIFEQARVNRINNIFLEVRRSNTTARNLYLKCGFEEVGLRKNYYRLEQGREDAIIMQLSLG